MAMKIKCLLVDDEPLAIKLIEKHLEKMEGFEVAATCNNALKAFEILNSQPIDLLFLDIKMPNMTGIEFLRNLKHPPKTILTTAYRDFALESYDIGVVDYLLKPITFERFFKAVDKFLVVQQNAKVKPETAPADPFVVLKSGVKNYKINTDDILYIESLKDYIKIFCVGGNPIVFKYKIGDIELELDSTKFLRVHRSFLINTRHITAFTNHEIDVKGIEIPIGASYKEPTMRFLESIRR
ncbi:LytR/AlgR family response regulator transcription factor [Flavobacterium sp.]|uniref:LytR/AlgR family response regulator transcription factor n=1 Tax=Flavobacterium sp. TaxID=239 RepID=UPI0039E22C5F